MPHLITPAASSNASTAPENAGTRQQPRAVGDFTTQPRVILLIALALVIGLLATGTAWLLLRLIALCTSLAYHGRWSFAPLSFHSTLGYAAALIPVAGAFVIGLMARYGSEKIRGHGIPEAIEAILIGKSRISAKVALLKPLSSAISIGTGGPFGAEGPIIMTGGAVGSLLAQAIHLTSAERKALLVSGAAAGMTAIFGTPLAAVLLAVELLLFEWKPRSFLPVLAAVAVSATARPYLMGAAPIFAYHGLMAPSGWALPAWALVGLACGLASGLLTALVYGSEDAFEALPIHWMWWPMIGGLVVGIGGLIDPAALGVGYDSIRHLLSGATDLRAAAMLLGVKAVIWAVALGSGTSGGVLAPLLIFGGCLGALMSPILPHADPGFWALIGMAAMMGGTMRAPLTSTIFAVELTGNHDALLPLLVACGAAFATTVLLLKRSILTEKIARRGLHLTREYHADPFEQTWVRDVMVRQVDTLPDTISIEEAVRFFTAPTHRHKTYPLVDADNRLAGMLSRADILRWTSVSSAIAKSDRALDHLDPEALTLGHADETVGALTDRMAANEAGRVPIVDSEGRLLGLVARKDVLSARARRVAEDHDRMAFVGPRRTA